VKWRKQACTFPLDRTVHLHIASNLSLPFRIRPSSHLLRCSSSTHLISNTQFDILANFHQIQSKSETNTHGRQNKSRHLRCARNGVHRIRHLFFFTADKHFTQHRSLSNISFCMYFYRTESTNSLACRCFPAGGELPPLFSCRIRSRIGTKGGARAVQDGLPCCACMVLSCVSMRRHCA